MTLSKNTVIGLLLFVLAFFIFTRGLNHHGFEYRDDEIFYFKSTQEMRADQNYLTPTYFGKPRFQKPILFYWFILGFYQIFGVSWFAARFASALFGAGAIVLTWLIAKELFNRRVALLSSLMLITLPIFFRHAKNAVPDMALNFFIVWAFYCAIKFFRQPERSRYSILFFVACGLGFMIKGFAALVFPFLGFILMCAFQKKWSTLKQMGFIRGFFILGLIIAPWFLYMIHTHGSGYLDYMLVDETKDRLMGPEQTDAWLKRFKSFGEHLLFYLRIFMTTFLPWSLFAILGTLNAFIRQKGKIKFNEQLQWLCIWIFSVVLIFSAMYVALGHYFLVLTTPFVILVSYLLLEQLDEPFFMRQLVTIFIPCFFAISTLFAFSFVSYFLANVHVIKVIMMIVLIICLLMYFRERKLELPFIYLLLVTQVIVLGQSNVLVDAKLTTHATLRQFAQIIKEDSPAQKTIGVGSHGIHEKEFQVYFDDKIIKAGTSHEMETWWNFNKLFEKKGEIYCLIKEKDYLYYLAGGKYGKFEIVHEDYMTRKKYRFNRDFLNAVMHFDRRTVYSFFMDKILLVKRINDV